MLNQIINVVMPVAITGIVAVLAAILKVIGDNVVSYIGAKKNAIVAQVGIDTYNSNLKKAKDIWGLVDEEFRITPTLEKTIEAKQGMFDNLLKAKIPSLTDDEINTLRQTIAGEINKGKAVITADAVAQQNELIAVKAQNVQLTAEKENLSNRVTELTNQNTQLTTQINNVQAAVTPVATQPISQ